MLRKKGQCREQVIPHMKGGLGSFHLAHIAEASEMSGKNMMFAIGTLGLQDTVGMHTHRGSMEICFFIAGLGLVKEDGAEYEVSAGDVSICLDGQSHEIVNVGKEALKYLLLIVQTEENRYKI